IRELNAFENAEWNAAMKRRAQSMLQMQTLQQPTQPGQPSFTPIASIEARQSFWKLQAAPQFPILAKAAQRLLSAHASTAAAERNWSMWGHTYHNALRNNFSVEAAKREVYLKANVPTTDTQMPVVSIVTNSTLSLEVKVTVSKAITSAAATILKTPAAHVHVHLSDAQFLSFGGDYETPCAVITVKGASMQISEEARKKLVSFMGPLLQNIAVGDQIMVFSGLRAGLVSDSTPNVRRSMS
ncbi:hypothetical protein QJQ45_021081, partial [Haematococcus lacustris]